MTTKEFQLLKTLALAPGYQATRREVVIDFGLNWETYDERRLEAIVSRLRRKITDATGSNPTPLKTLHGVGYVFLEPLHLG